MDFHGRQLIVLANREPYKHEQNHDGRLVATRCSSGVVNAVEPLMRSGSAVWVAEGVGAADRLAATNRDGVEVGERHRYRVRRVFLDESERQGYYDGFANSGLWPLCHRTSVEPTFYATDFQQYELVNRRFADAVSDEALGASPIIFVQDYHFALAPRLIRKQLPLSRIATFWHIPWPRAERFEICPWTRCLLDGLLGSTLVGFQTAVDRQHFFDAVERTLHCDIDLRANVIAYKGRDISVGVYPASIEWPGRWATDAPPPNLCRSSVRQELGLADGVQLAVGVDRLDYTKGLEQKFLAVERLLERRPSLVGRFSLLQIAEPTRATVPVYQHTRARVVEAAERINRRFTAGGVSPIILCESSHSPRDLARFFRAADICYVGSLHDGMNLVSKEFVCARDDEHGVLVLSVFAGAAHELTDAMQINPYDIDASAAALAAALAMDRREQRQRMRRLRQVVASADARHWAARMLGDVLSPQRRPSFSAPASISADLSYV